MVWHSASFTNLVALPRALRASISRQALAAVPVRRLNVDASKAGSHFQPEDLVYIPSFISKEEHDLLASECEVVLKHRKWEEGHWDSVITLYREIQKSRWTQAAKDILDRVYKLDLFPPGTQFFPYVHVLDLHADGEINHHVDNDYCGDYVAGLTLLSPRVMEFRRTAQGQPAASGVTSWTWGAAEPIGEQGGGPEPNADQFDKMDEGVVKMLVEPCSFYIMRRTMRYDWTHAIMGGNGVRWKERLVPSERRISLMFRDVPRKMMRTSDSSPSHPS